MNNIDWSNPKCKISKYFTVKEALFLPSWGIMHTPSEEEKTNIIKLANKMDMVRELFNSAISVHCWIRPILNNPNSKYHNQDYNAFVNGAKKSAHKLGKAIDFHISNISCDDVRTTLISRLEEFGIRMENIPGGTWVHIDCDDVITERYFKP